MTELVSNHYIPICIKVLSNKIEIRTHLFKNKTIKTSNVKAKKLQPEIDETSSKNNSVTTNGFKFFMI